MDGRELRIFNERTVEVQFLRKENRRLTDDLGWYRAHDTEADQQIADLEDDNRRLRTVNERLTRRVAELTDQLRRQAAAGKAADGGNPSNGGPPAFVKPNLPADRPRRRPGRKAGHVAALRPLPAKIDQVVEVPLAADARGRALCPRCRGVLTQLESHARIVEDLTPCNVQVTKFKTRSGYCVNCDRQVESRAAQQPPAAPGIPHGQVGINALALGLMLRVRHRLPFRQITQVFDRMAGLRLCPGALVKQVKRIARWLGGEYRKLILRARASAQLHVDETGWRIDGRDAWAWVFTQPLLTLYVCNRPRGGQVVRDILGEEFDGTVVCDFYRAYDKLKCPKQRCLTHLLREIRDTSAKAGPAFADDPWVVKLKRWCQDGIALKKKWKVLPDPKYEMRASRIEDRLDALMKTQPSHADARRLRKRIERYRPELTRFLWDENLEPTNNPAERALRPLVVARKISGGSRSAAHAEAWAKLSSILATQEQNGRNVLEATKSLLVSYWARGAR